MARDRLIGGDGRAAKRFSNRVVRPTTKVDDGTIGGSYGEILGTNSLLDAYRGLSDPGVRDDVFIGYGKDAVRTGLLLYETPPTPHFETGFKTIEGVDSFTGGLVATIDSIFRIGKNQTLDILHEGRIIPEFDDFYRANTFSPSDQMPLDVRARYNTVMRFRNGMEKPGVSILYTTELIIPPNDGPFAVLQGLV